ncbi:Alpha-L-fucosidase [Bertholletia excelsa]
MALKLVVLPALALTFISSYLVLLSAANFSYPAVFNFGDSNSDTGGLVAGIGFPLGLPDGLTFFHERSGRFCDGRVIVDFLISAMGKPFLSPYLDSVGAPSFQTGINFATGGTTLLPARANSFSPFSLDIQVKQFIRFKARVLELLTKDKKLQKYLPKEEYFSQGVYMFDIGQNDLDGAFYSKSENEVVAFIPTILAEFDTRLQELYNQGARNFWIHNTGPLGCLPRIIAKFGNDTSKLDEAGCLSSHNRAAKLFNAQLHDLCLRFRQQFPEANVTYVDIFSIKLNLISNYTQFGFKQPIAACCGYGGLPLNFDSRIACGQTKVLNGSSVTAKPCDNTSEYINWDGNHYTEAANQYVSTQILTGKYSNPPLVVPVQSRFYNLMLF